MDPKKLQNFDKFFNNSRKLWNFNKFIPPAQNSWQYRKFLPTEHFWQKFHKCFSPHKIDQNFTCFVPGTNRENFYKFLSLRQNWETKFFDLAWFVTGGRPPVTKRYARFVTGRTPPPPPHRDNWCILVYYSLALLKLGLK